MPDAAQASETSSRKRIAGTLFQCPHPICKSGPLNPRTKRRIARPDPLPPPASIESPDTPSHRNLAAYHPVRCLALLNRKAVQDSRRAAAAEESRQSIETQTCKLQSPKRATELPRQK